MKGTKIFMKKKKKKGIKKARDRYKNLSEEKKKEKALVSSWLKYESFWIRKAKESWVYENLLLSPLEMIFRFYKGVRNFKIPRTNFRISKNILIYKK